jgi:hypothetical protein
LIDPNHGVAIASSTGAHDIPVNRLYSITDGGTRYRAVSIGG